MLSTVLPLKITQRLFYHFYRKKIDFRRMAFYRNIFIAVCGVVAGGNGDTGNIQEGVSASCDDAAMLIRHYSILPFQLSLSSIPIITSVAF
ncbi:hypothetical protein GWP49_32145 [Klebsiella pneumoniae]|nr:hypothetical protein [Klebsiella pneumoniae]